MRRAAWGAGLMLWAAAAAAHEAPARPEVSALLQRADAALAAGQAEEAQATYEQAAALQHAAHIEVGWVRARMQAGGYRQALAFAAHAAGAHPDEAEGALLYAHLLSAGGQSAAAQEVLTRARRRLPGEARLPSGLTACPSHGGVGTQAELHPMPLGEPLPAGAVVAGSALLLGDARHALVPLVLVEGDAPLWVRNGLGRSQRAQVLSRDTEAGTALLQLAAPLDAPAALSRAPREAFPGSPGFVAGYRSDAHALPAWPQLCIGFLGHPPREGGPRRLGIGVEDGSVGAPVFDNAGRLVGLVGPPDAAGATLLPARVLAGFAPTADAGPLPVDELYERSLRSSLQLITRRSRNE